MNIEWNIDDEFTAEQRSGSLEVLARMEFPLYDDHLAKLEDDELLEEAVKVADKLHPGFSDFFEELSDDNGDVVVVRGTVTVYVPVTHDESAIVEHALDAVDDNIEGGSKAVVELFVFEVVD